MSETMIIGLEDVLLTGDNKIDRHLAMYNGLRSQFSTVILTTMDRDEAKRLMLLHHIRYDILLDKGDSILTNASWKVSSVRECLSASWRIGLFLDVDATAVREVFAMGISSMLLSHHLLRPAWLPGDGPPRAWEELVAFQEAQAERSAEARAANDVHEVSGGDGRRFG